MDAQHYHHIVSLLTHRPSPLHHRSGRAESGPIPVCAELYNKTTLSSQLAAGLPAAETEASPPQAAILGDVTDLIAIPLGDGTQILATVKTNAQGVHTIGLQCDEGKPGLVVRVWAFSKSRHNL